MDVSAAAVTGGLLIMNTVWDLRKKEILLLPTLLILAGGVICRILEGTAEEIQLLSGQVSSGAGGWQWIPAVLPGVFLLLLSLASKGKVGFGDGLVVCAAGLWCGPESILLALFFALLLVPAAAGMQRLRKRKVRELPFVPFLLAGFVLQRMLMGS